MPNGHEHHHSAVTETLEPPVETVATPPPKPQRTLLDILATDAGYERMLNKLKVMPHPVLPIPDRATCINVVQSKGEEALIDLLQRRSKTIHNELTNPIYFGYEPQQWRDADDLLASHRVILVTGGKRSSKTEWRSKRVTQNLTTKPNWKAWCMSTSAETSIRDQQQYVWKYLPFHLKKAAERRATARHRGTTILYTSAKGFSDKVFTCPSQWPHPPSECRFMNYQQDAQVIEGGAINEFWGDEEMPPDWLSRLMWRIIDRGGKGVITYTSDTGFTPTLSDFFTGSKVVKSIKSPLPELQGVKLWPGLPRGEVPYILECLDPSRAVIFFQPHLNDYVPWGQFVESLERLAPHVKALRAHGVTQKVSGSCFPKFGKHNIVPHEKVTEALQKQPCTRYHVIDFAWQRNWAQLWAAVQRIGNRKRIFIYREWPDGESYGEWVTPGSQKKPDGMAGPAQAAVLSGPEDYKREIKKLETGADGKREEVFERYGDPKSGDAENFQDEGSFSIFQLLLNGDDPMVVSPVVAGPNMWHITEGVNLINEWLNYDQDKPIVPLLNEPMLYVSDKCQNLIDCLKMWTGRDGDKGASKDFVDALRYLAMMDIDHIEDMGPRARKRGAY